MKDFTKQKLTAATGGHETHVRLDQLDNRVAEVTQILGDIGPQELRHSVESVLDSRLAEFRASIATDVDATVGTWIAGLDSELAKLLHDLGDKLNSRVTRLVLLEESQFEAISVKLDYLTKRVEELSDQIARLSP